MLYSLELLLLKMGSAQDCYYSNGFTLIDIQVAICSY